ncbi:MAG TPA: hypothetical protein VFE24_16395 [Pirellulales bacterium]|jgi:hypothetical protein|nr:hypothetical protein [Pirellulales bacterium]
MLLSANPAASGMMAEPFFRGEAIARGALSGWREYPLRRKFASLQAQLQAPQYETLWQQPLGFWACDSDRALPIVLLDWTLGEVIHRSFAELRNLPRVGVKKLAGLLTLLGRAAQTTPAEERATALEAADRSATRLEPATDEPLASDLNERIWQQWKATIVRHGLAGEPLGRFSESLQDLPKPLWSTALSEFLPLSLDGLRARKNYGTKRVTAILQVFGLLHSLFEHAAVCHLCPRLIPNRLAAAESWLRNQREQARLPELAELNRDFLLPILEQVEHDLGREPRELLELRIGTRGAPLGVSEIASRLNLGLRRTYHILDLCSAALEIRWPQGGSLLQQWSRQSAGDPSKELLCHLKAVAKVFCR